MRIVRTVTLPTGMTMVFGCSAPVDRPPSEERTQPHAPPERTPPPQQTGAAEMAQPVTRIRPCAWIAWKSYPETRNPQQTI